MAKERRRARGGAHQGQAAAHRDEPPSLVGRDAVHAVVALEHAQLAPRRVAEQHLAADDVRAVTTEEALEAVRKTFAEGNQYIEAHLLPEEGEF